MNNWLREKLSILWGNLKPLAIGLDCACNVVVCTLTLQKAWPCETMSAHCWRAYRDSKVFGRLLMPPIDAVIALWQKPDPQFCDPEGVPIKGHCRRAYEKTRKGFYLPAEYSDNQPLLMSSAAKE